ncbi:hypothetical protein BH23GEM10_BH23GEM10_08690 [soil metagenome]
MLDNKKIRDAFGSLTGRRGSFVAGMITVVLIIGVAAFARVTPADRIVVQEAAPVAAGSEGAGDAATSDAASSDALAEHAEAVDGAEARAMPALTDAMFEFAPITDGVPRMKKPDVVRGLYLNVWAAASNAKLARLIGVANNTEINAFVIDVKEGGEVGYRSQVPLARAIGADQAYIGDVRGMLRKLNANGIYPIARIVVFRDATLADAYPEVAVRHVDGGDWEDRDGHRWVDSFNRQVWDYNIAIAREALELGFAEIQWDYVRFPDVPQSLMRTAAWPARDGRTKAEGIREFLQYSRAQLAEYDAPITADVFGLAVSAGNDLGIGQHWESMADVTDVLLPMVYPSHFARGSYGIAHPNAQPFETIVTAMRHAVRRNAGIENAAGIRPWLQDFTLGQPRYGAAEVRAQIDAVYEAGLKEWVLWHPGSNYTVEALATRDGVVPRFEMTVDPAATADTAARSGVLGRPVRLAPDSSGVNR